MSMSDINTRLSGTTGSSAAGQSIAAATAAAPVYSTNWLDMGLTGTTPNQRDLRDLFALVWPTTTVDSATNTATLDIEIVMVPTTTPATPTLVFTAAGFATDTMTSTAHGLPNGTRVTVASVTTLPAGLTASTNYYVRDAAADTFKLTLVPGGTAVDITDAGSGTHTATWFPEVVGAAPKIGLERLIANVAQVQLVINPLLIGPGNGVPVHRYLFARYVPTANLTAGVVFCDLRTGAPMANFPINPNNYVTP